MSGSMKVLHLDSGAQWRGGQQQVYSLVKGLKRLAIEQRLALRAGGELAARVQELNGSVSTLSFFSEWDPVAFIRLKSIAQDFNPDIIHAHDSRTLGLVRLLRVFGVKSKLVASRRVAFPIRNNPFWKFKYQHGTDRIIAVSRFIRDLLVRDGIQPEKIEVVYDGFEWESLGPRSERSASRQRLGLEESELLIGTAGWFSPEKGHELLIRAFHKVKESHPRARLLIVGDGKLRGRYQKLIADLGLHGQVLIPGFLPNLQDVLSALDLFIFPSLHEGLGSTLLMAMAHQIPVCASQTGGIPEVVIPGQTGFLFPPGNIQALAETILHALQHPALAQLQQRNAYRLVQEYFRFERMISETYKIYCNVLGI
jgi:glycosyltransferase involved in cell wall biosynthesis